MVHFARQYSHENGITPGGFSETIQDCFNTYLWPGNIRELDNEVRRIVELLDDGELISDHHLLPSIREFCPSASINKITSGVYNLKQQVDEFTRQLVITTLKEEGGIKIRAAEKLGISYRWLAKLMKRLQV